MVVNVISNHSFLTAESAHHLRHSHETIQNDKILVHCILTSRIAPAMKRMIANPVKLGTKMVATPITAAAN